MAGCPVSAGRSAKANLPGNPNRLLVMGMNRRHSVSAGLGQPELSLPVPLLCAREFPARIPGSIKGRRRSQFLSQMYLASAADFATFSHGDRASALSSDHFCFSIGQVTLAL